MTKDIDIKEIQKDVSEYISKKYGQKIQITGLGPLPDKVDGNIEDGANEAPANPPSIRFDMKPRELKAYLDEYMIKQDEAKQVLATKICTHFNRIQRYELNRRKKQADSIGSIKNNIIMIGPTGVGKTFLVKLIANKIGVPFVKGDATKFSETGYVGGDVEDLVRDLVHEAKGNIELAQYGIIYLDEIDKIASSNSLIGPDVSRAGVQRALLKPMEETEVDLKVPHDPISQIEALKEYQRTGKREKKTINTKNILFIMSGAFTALDSIVKKRRSCQGIGFGAEIRSKGEDAGNMKHLKAEDLIQYGFESEFIGRLPVVTILEHLEIEDLYKILRNPKNPIIIGKKRDFKAYGIDLLFEDEALMRIAENAFNERTGARGLVSAIERVLIKFEHMLPSTDIRRLLVTPMMVTDPDRELDKLLANPDDPEKEAAFIFALSAEQERLEQFICQKLPEWRQCYGINFSNERIKLLICQTVDGQAGVENMIEELQAVQRVVENYAKIFSDRIGLEVSFTDEAIDRLAEKAWNESLDVEDYLNRSFQHYDHGLKLIREKTGKRSFIITDKGVDHPKEFLNRLIQEAYRQKQE